MVEGIERLLAWKLDIHHTDPRGTTHEISGGSTSRYSPGHPGGRARCCPRTRSRTRTSCPGGVLMDRLFDGRGASATPKAAYTRAVLTDGLPKAYDHQPSRWVASEKGDRPDWDVRFSEPLDWSLRITDEDGELVRATGGVDEQEAQRTWDLRDAAGTLVDAGHLHGHADRDGCVGRHHARGHRADRVARR